MGQKSGKLTSWGWQFIALLTEFYTSQVVQDFFTVTPIVYECGLCSSPSVLLAYPYPKFSVAKYPRYIGTGSVLAFFFYTGVEEISGSS